MGWRGDGTGFEHDNEPEEEEEEQVGQLEGVPEGVDAQQLHRAHLEREAIRPADGDVEQCRRARLEREAAQRREQRQREGMPASRGYVRLSNDEAVMLAHMFVNYVGVYRTDANTFYKEVEREFYFETGKYLNAKRYKERWTAKHTKAEKEDEGKSGSAGRSRGDQEQAFEEFLHQANISAPKKAQGQKRKAASSGGSSTQTQNQAEVRVLRENMTRRLGEREGWETAGEDHNEEQEEEPEDQVEDRPADQYDAESQAPKDRDGSQPRTAKRAKTDAAPTSQAPPARTTKGKAVSRQNTQTAQLLEGNRKLSLDMLDRMDTQDDKRQQVYQAECQKDRDQLTNLFQPTGVEQVPLTEFNQRLSNLEESAVRREERDRQREEREREKEERDRQREEREREKEERAVQLEAERAEKEAARDAQACKVQSSIDQMMEMMRRNAM
jgi:hypothetical protein